MAALSFVMDNQFAHVQTADAQLVHLENAQAGAPDRQAANNQPTDGERTNRDSSDRESANREAADGLGFDCLGANCLGADGCRRRASR